MFFLSKGDDCDFCDFLAFGATIHTPREVWLSAVWGIFSSIEYIYSISVKETDVTHLAFYGRPTSMESLGI